MPAAAAIAERDLAGGGEPCGLHWTGPMFQAYVPAIKVVTERDQLNECSTAYALIPTTDERLIGAADEHFRCQTILPAVTPGQVFSHSPVAHETVCR